MFVSTATRNPSVGSCHGGPGFAYWSRNNLFPRKSLSRCSKRELCDLNSQNSSALQEEQVSCQMGQLQPFALERPALCSFSTGSSGCGIPRQGSFRCVPTTSSGPISSGSSCTDVFSTALFLKSWCCCSPLPSKGVNVCLWLCLLNSGNVRRSPWAPLPEQQLNLGFWGFIPRGWTRLISFLLLYQKREGILKEPDPRVRCEYPALARLPGLMELWSDVSNAF